MAFGDFFDLNKYAKYFRIGRMADDLKEREALFNSQGLSQEQMDMGNYNVNNVDSYGRENSYYGGYLNGMTSVNIQFDQYFVNKTQRIATYREMSRFPEISDALDNICNDAICEKYSTGRVVDLDIKEELPKHIEEQVRKIWDYLLNDVFNFSETGWGFFKRWLIDGEFYAELILNNEGDNIIGIKVLPAHTIVPVYNNNIITEYIQSVKPINIDGGYDHAVAPSKDDNIVFDKSQIVYINYGDVGRNRYDVMGFLEASIRTYNQLKNLEDAVVIYRLVRAPERRMWNINVGKMPKTKAEEYLRGIMQRYRKRIKYDSSTGAMDSSQNVQAMVEDFWFPKNGDGEGTTVEVLGGGQNLGEMQDVEYFLKKLYITLKQPSSRWGNVDSSDTYTTGKSGEITREEVRFSRFIERQQKKFSYLLLDAFITLLRLRGIDERYIDHSLYNIVYTETNKFKEYMELEVLGDRFALLASIDTFIYKPEENENGYFSKEFVLRNWFMMSPEEYDKNEELIKREKKARASEIEAAGFKTSDEEGVEGSDFGGEEPSGGGFGSEGGDFQAGAEGGGFEGAIETEEPAEEVSTEEGFIHNVTDSVVLKEFFKEDTEIIKKSKNIPQKVISEYKKMIMKNKENTGE